MKVFSYETPTEEDFDFEINGELVKCVGSLDGLTLLSYTANMGADVPVTIRARTMESLLREAVIDYDAFAKVIKRNKIDIENLADICRYIVRVYSDVHPTQSPTPPSGGESATGPSSEGGSS